MPWVGFASIRFLGGALLTMVLGVSVLNPLRAQPFPQRGPLLQSPFFGRIASSPLGNLPQSGFTFKQLHEFKGSPDAGDTSGELVAVNGVLYGTSAAGGAGPCRCGTVFKITATGKASVVYSFKGGADGEYPNGDLVEAGGALYGTTELGGLHSGGTVFKTTASGSEQVVHSFGCKAGICATDGSDPWAGLTGLAGNLYGTTVEGGAGYAGTVFEIGLSGAERIVYSFKPDGTGLPRSVDGYMPTGRLAAVGNVLYGTTGVGGLGGLGWGTIFSVTPGGLEKVLYTFTGGGDGAEPIAGLLYLNGALYGTTSGSSNLNPYGNVFEFSLATRLLHVLHTFHCAYIDCVTGSNPDAGLTVLNGALFGTTSGVDGNVYDVAFEVLVP